MSVTIHVDYVNRPPIIVSPQSSSCMKKKTDSSSKNNHTKYIFPNYPFHPCHKLNVLAYMYIYLLQVTHVFVYAIVIYQSQSVIGFTDKISQGDHRIYLCTCFKFYLHSRTRCLSCKQTPIRPPLLSYFSPYFSLLQNVE